VQICQRILWTWNGRDGWKAPDWPRGQYLGNSALNKLYLIGTALSVEKAAESEKKELAQFAEIFLPEVSRILYPPANRPAVPK
jgi:hypothetical protein